MWAYLCKEIVQAQRQSSNRYLSNQILISPKPFYKIDPSPLRSWAGGARMAENNRMEFVRESLPTVDSQNAT